MFHKKTIRDVPIDNKSVLVRVDYNVPLEEDGTIADDFRIRQSLETLKYLIKRKCKITICSHLGRPEGKPDKKYSLERVAERLQKLIGIEVIFVDEAVGDRAFIARKKQTTNEIIMLENLRFDAREEGNDAHFAKELAKNAEYFVQDGFGVVHRAHASTDAITHYLPGVAGFLLEKEVSTILGAMKSPKHPVISIVGGAKIKDKIDVIKNFMKISETVIVGGVMANTLMVAKGYGVGNSKYEDEEIPEANHLLEHATESDCELFVPHEDVAVGDKFDETAKRREIDIEDVKSNDIIMDFGRKTMEEVCHNISNAHTVFWNGPLGVVEFKNFNWATTKLSECVAANHHLTSIVGGGDTTGFIDELGMRDKFTHVSTGGGASLELMAGYKLPGVEALLNS